MEVNVRDFVLKVWRFVMQDGTKLYGPNDSGVPGLENGVTEVWYMTPKTWEDFETREHGPDINNLNETHILLAKVAETDLNRLWRNMQGENWSPNGQANALLWSKKLCHTSMAVGDVVVLPNRDVYVVDMVGFKYIGRKK